MASLDQMVEMASLDRVLTRLRTVNFACQCFFMGEL